jgi:transcriptional regulator GlxA family with amidase domain
MRRQRQKVVAMLAYEQVGGLEITGPLDVFGEANEYLTDRGRAELYDLRVVSPGGGRVHTTRGIPLHADDCYALDEVDTLLVGGGRGIHALVHDARLLRWLRRIAPRARRVGSVCTGTFLLAAAGLLDGKKATTHWKYCARLANEFPGVAVEPDPIFVQDGRVWSSAGASACMDLALALVEEDLGHEVALTCARELVLFLQRPGGQAQFSAQLAAQVAERRPIRSLQTFIVEHPDGDLSIDALASRAAMSPRNFARVFRAEVGTTPARYVERVRVEAARRHLEETRDGVDEIAVRVGFGSAESMRKAFLRALAVPPSAYRGRFRARA